MKGLLATIVFQLNIWLPQSNFVYSRIIKTKEIKVMKFKLPNQYRVGSVHKATNSHTGEKNTYKIKSIQYAEKTDNIIELKNYLNQEGFDFYFDDKGMGLFEQIVGPVINDIVNIHFTRGAILKLQNDNYKITIYDRGNGFELYRLEVFNQGQGLGSKFLNTLHRISCELDYPVFLKSGMPGNKTEYRSEEQYDARKEFYLKNNFNIIKNGVMPTFSNQQLVDAYYKNVVA